MTLLSCSNINKDKNLSDNETLIKSLQKKTLTSPIDSTYYYLKQANTLINNNPKVSDSLKAENNFLLGEHFLKLNKLDSASLYFHFATDFIKDSIYFNRQSEYFTKAWDTYFSLEKFGDCLTISNRFKSLLNFDKQHRALTWAYYFEESVYIESKDYNNALLTNNLRVNLAKEKDTINLVNALISRAKIKYYYLDDKKSAFLILDSILKYNKLKISLKSNIYNELGIFYYWESNYINALKNYKTSLFYSKQLNKTENNTINLAIKYNNIAEVLLDLKEYKPAKKYLDSVNQLGINNIDKKHQKSFLKYNLRLAAMTNKNFKEVTVFLDSIYNYQER